MIFLAYVTYSQYNHLVSYKIYVRKFAYKLSTSEIRLLLIKYNYKSNGYEPFD